MSSFFNLERKCVLNPFKYQIQLNIVNKSHKKTKTTACLSAVVCCLVGQHFQQWVNRLLLRQDCVYMYLRVPSTYFVILEFWTFPHLGVLSIGRLWSEPQVIFNRLPNAISHYLNGQTSLFFKLCTSHIRLLLLQPAQKTQSYVIVYIKSTYLFSYCGQLCCLKYKNASHFNQITYKYLLLRLKNISLVLFNTPESLKDRIKLEDQTVKEPRNCAHCQLLIFTHYIYIPYIQ